MILTGMNNGISSVYVETVFEIAENQGEVKTDQHNIKIGNIVVDVVRKDIKNRA